MHYFELLTPDEKRAVIRKMANAGQSEFLIASATRLSIELVRQILGERPK
jgi:hypothetical protein